MKIDVDMAEKGGGGSTDNQPTLKTSRTSPNLQSLSIDTPQLPQLPEAPGWKGFMRRRGSAVDFLSKPPSLDIPKRILKGKLL